MDRCTGCGRPIESGQPCWGGREPEESWHWDCFKKKRPEPSTSGNLYKDLAVTIERGQAALDKLKQILGRRR